MRPPTGTDPLARVLHAANWRRAAEHEYRAALEAALSRGCTYAQLARELGQSRQAVRQYVLAGTSVTRPSRAAAPETPGSAR